jgi:mannose-6-phosphate isomerase-like protein (cupin superfamily)
LIGYRPRYDGAIPLNSRERYIFKNMQPTRRDLGLLLPALLAAPTSTPALPSRCYEFGELPVKKDSKTHNEARQVFDGYTHTGFPVNLHITTLAPGTMPHAAHHHAHEEAIFIKEGTLEVTIKDKTSRIGPGSVAYVNSNEEHGWKNVGDVPATYFVLALGEEKGA